MNKEYIYHIYINLFEYLEYRGKEKPKQLSKKECIDTINSDNMILIILENIVIVLTKPQSKFAILGADSKKKIKDLCGQYSDIKEFLYICDVNYIALKTNTSLNIVKKTIADLNGIYKDIWFQIRPYSIFELNIPQCVVVPKHSIISKQEVKKLFEAEYKNKNSIPQIYEWDAPITWLGASSGQFVEIERYSSSVGIQKIIRHVIV